MPRRLPTLRPLTLVATVGLLVLASAVLAQPPAPPAAPPAPGNKGGDIKRTQEENLRLYKRFADELLKLAQRWEKSDNPEERERAKTLRAALKLADEKGVENLFKAVVNGLDGSPTPGGITAAINKDRELIKALELILETLETEDELTRLQKEIADLKALIKDVQAIKRNEENIRARTDLPKSDPNRIAKDQNDNANKTKDVIGKMTPKDPKNPNGNPNNNTAQKDDKSDPKPGAKPGESAAEPKSDTDKPKSDDKVAAGDPKNDPKPEPKPGGMKPDAAQDKPAGMMPDAGGAKPMGDQKPMPGGEPKPMQGDSKSQGDGKGQSKPSAGQAGDAKPMTSPNSTASNSPPSDSKPSGSPSGSPGSPSNPNAQPNPNDNARNKLEETLPDQKGAEDDLKKNDRDNAGKKEDEVIKKLAQVLDELEKRLKQLREKEMLKKLEDLERRVAKMLRMQTEVYEATKAIDATVRKNGGQKSGADRQRSGVQAEIEGQISEEAEKALKLLEGEGTAVVFAGVLAELKKDMDAVRRQLDEVNVGEDTQLVEKQIIEQLQRMLEALKKAKQDLQNPPPPPPGDPPPSDKKQDLIKLVEQLKLLRELQVQVNERTAAFGKRTPGEQSGDPFIREQLRQLAERQKFLQDLLHKIATDLNQ